MWIGVSHRPACKMLWFVGLIPFGEDRYFSSIFLARGKGKEKLKTQCL